MILRRIIVEEIMPKLAKNRDSSVASWRAEDFFPCVYSGVNQPKRKISTSSTAKAAISSGRCCKCHKSSSPIIHEYLDCEISKARKILALPPKLKRLRW